MIYEVYADEFSVLFNAKTSIFHVFKGRECVEANASMCTCVNEGKIEKGECVGHLGHGISANAKECICKSAIASY